jgi:hypothetical protein
MVCADDFANRVEGIFENEFSDIAMWLTQPGQNSLNRVAVSLSGQCTKQGQWECHRFFQTIFERQPRLVECLWRRSRFE